MHQATQHVLLHAASELSEVHPLLIPVGADTHIAAVNRDAGLALYLGEMPNSVHSSPSPFGDKSDKSIVTDSDDAM
jgi:hypothetical protein